ncbi:serine hydrolase domain-containing protein [Compostibacter hankyongensis]|uniref:Serine hydrolase domain-containing protein n=1 Tax=Compostibacter hankyongensis TaxID=1007089 RepID=A0ABP8FKN3_9BACT
MRSILFLLIIAFPVLLMSACQSGVSREAGHHPGREAEAEEAFYHIPTRKEKRSILNADDTKEMVRGLDDFFDHKLGRNFNGAMLVARKGVVIFEKYKGYGDFSRKSPVNSHTTFQLASTSKPFTAMGILWLQEQGKLKITDSVQKYFPGFAYPGVTLKTLLNHRSGLPNYLYFSDDLWKDRSRLMTNQDVVDLMVKHHPRRQYPPDTHFSYCNTNYIILAAIIEQVSGKSLGAFLKATFFDPLGMKDTYVYNPNTDPLNPMQSLSYDYRAVPIANECFDGVVGDKNVYSTVNDLLKWDQALYGGKLFSDATLEAAFTPYSNEHPGIRNYGLGWRLLVYPDSLKMVYHNGWWHGNTSVFYRFIKDSTTLIILSNRYNKLVYQVKPLWDILHEGEGAAYAGDD